MYIKSAIFHIGIKKKSFSLLPSKGFTIYSYGQAGWTEFSPMIQALTAGRAGYVLLVFKLLLSGKTFAKKKNRADTSHEVSTLLVIFVFE